MPQYKHQCILYESCGESELKNWLISYLRRTEISMLLKKPLSLHWQN